MREGLIAPVFFGSALNGFGVRRLLKALRHDAPDAEAAAARLGADGDCAYAFKTAWAGQAGKLVYVRVLSGRINDGAELTLANGEKARASGLFQVLGSPTRKISLAERGEMVALGKVEAARAGDLLSGDGKARKNEAAARAAHAGLHPGHHHGRPQGRRAAVGSAHQAARGGSRRWCSTTTRPPTPPCSAARATPI